MSLPKWILNLKLLKNMCWSTGEFWILKSMCAGLHVGQSGVYTADCSREEIGENYIHSLHSQSHWNTEISMNIRKWVPFDMKVGSFLPGIKPGNRARESSPAIEPCNQAHGIKPGNQARESSPGIKPGNQAHRKPCWIWSHSLSSWWRGDPF